MQRTLPTDLAGSKPRLELWGGHECTVNRVQENWYDQTPRSGHEERLEDLALFAELGIRKLRYPVLWERIAPDRPDRRDFAWTDERLREIRRLGMEPIATLCHHGSGPRYTSLLDDGFAPGLARHAAAVARRYPWMRDYTPVNEPLTTARFSALYGYWYPHTQDERAFWLALLNEIDATRLSMRAIQSVNPEARLIQTDDLGFCHATPPLQAEADFQNQRRWMGWDLLCGMVTPDHALWNRLAAFGLGDRLRRIADDPCPPDVIGINHYLSSERLLDHRIELHANRSVADREVGEVDGVPCVDVDAIRSVPDQVIGLARLVEEASRRYGRSIAITECHLGATREEQARWFVEVWQVAEKVREHGADVRAVTAWSLLGSYDWNRMVTASSGHYEPGVFDVRGGTVRPTMMAGILTALARGDRPSGPALDVPGWWSAERRALCGTGETAFAVAFGPRDAQAIRPLVIVGDGETALLPLAIQACEARGLHYQVVDDCCQAARAVHPWGVLDLRNSGQERPCGELTALCSDRGMPGAIIRAHDAVAARELGGGLLVVDTGPIFTAAEDTDLALLLDRLDEGQDVTVNASRIWEGVYGPTLIDGVLDLLLDGADGQVYFLADPGVSLAEVARALADTAGHPSSRVLLQGATAPRSRSDYRLVSHLAPLESVLERFVNDRRHHRLEIEGQEGELELAAE